MWQIVFVELSLKCALKSKELMRAWIKEKEGSMISDGAISGVMDKLQSFELRQTGT